MAIFMTPTFQMKIFKELRILSFLLECTQMINDYTVRK
jgi:hypothetical protein